MPALFPALLGPPALVSGQLSTHSVPVLLPALLSGRTSTHYMPMLLPALVSGRLSTLYMSVLLPALLSGRPSTHYMPMLLPALVPGRLSTLHARAASSLAHCSHSVRSCPGLKPPVSNSVPVLFSSTRLYPKAVSARLSDLLFHLRVLLCATI